MAIKDNREFIEILEKTGDVVRIKQEVDWDLEVGAIARRTCEMNGPAPFFDKLKDYPEGYRIFAMPLATYRRVAIALGLDPDTSPRAIQAEYRNRIQHPIKPVVVNDAPCKEKIIQGEDVNLFQFPVPMVHEGDGGRYIGTWHGVVVKDPDSDWTNWGMYRLMTIDRRYMSGLCAPYSHQWRIIKSKYMPGENVPFAVFIGADPLCSLVSSGPFGRRSEVDYAGALRKEPVELVKCETNDLLVPAHAEIILEGEIVPHARAEEGPFGEFTGYSSDPRSPKLLYKIHAITHRNNPILTMSCPGIPTCDSAIAQSLHLAVLFERLLTRHGIPYTGVWVPPQAETFIVVVGVKTIYPNIATLINNIIASAQTVTNQVIVVDEDVDVFNLDQVLHALSTKCHPVRGIRVSDQQVMVLTLEPYLSPEERRTGRDARVVFDCTWPLDWPRETSVPRRISFNEAYPEAVKSKVEQNWHDYGFE